jgi:AraC-like DNA-binding protein
VLAILAHLGGIMNDMKLLPAIDRFLTEPWQWRIISSLFPSDIQPVYTSGHRQHTHSHTHREILLCLSGNGCHRLGQHVYPLAPGTIMLFDEFDEHDVGYSSTSPDLDHIWIVVLKGRYLVRLNSIRDGQLLMGMEWLLTETEVGVSLNHHWSIIAESSNMPLAVRHTRMVSALLLLAGEISEQASSMQDRDHSTFQKEVIHVVQQHIQDTGGNSASIDHLAHIAGYSPFHFIRLFKQYTGMSVHEYVDLCRLEKFAQLIKEGYNQKQIGETLGFSCPSTFSRWLRSQRRQGHDI